VLAGTHNFTIDQGATFSRRISVKNSDNTVYPLGGCTVQMQIRRDYRSTSPMVTLTSDDDSISIFTTTGEIVLYLSDEQTRDLTSDGVYDIEIENASGERFRLLQGKVRLRPEVTR
jgi:hypothetical protein